MVVALSIAGSDSIGGAGIQADIKAMASLGVHAATVVTAITSQNTERVFDILAVPPGHIASQLDAVLADAEVRAAKTGMLHDPETAQLVASRLKHSGIRPVVDPVLFAGVGDRLCRDGLVEAIKKELLPIAACVTPNREEAEALTGLSVSSLADAREACSRIADLGARIVVVKGGHIEGGDATDILYDGEEFVELRSPRVPVKVHGSGCVFSAYIAAYLALGTEPREAVVQAKERIAEAIDFHHSVGKGSETTEPLASVLMETARYSVMTSLKEATEELEDFIAREWVPEVGTNFVYALPHARYSEDVCALESRIIGKGGGVVHSGCYSFGGSRHVARVVLEAMRHDPQMRAAINVRFTPEHMEAVREAGLSVASFNRRHEPRKAKTMEWGTRSAIASSGGVPDAIFDEGGPGKEPMIRVLGKDPHDVTHKLKRVMRKEVE